MSRIYEALRRAEAERAAGRQPRAEPETFTSQAVLEGRRQDPDGLPPGTDTPAEPLPEIFPEPLAQVSIPAQPESPLRAGQTIESGGLVTASPAVDLETIASAPWTPALEHLPAVQERGRTVEQFRSLRSRMQEFRGANRTKSILVTSGLPQEGKSFVAVNLAVSLARHKISSVLLIDGDMRRSSLHKILGCPNDGPGLTEYLSGQATLQQIMKRPAPDPGGAPLPHGFGSLIFIGAGAEADKAADLSGNHRFEALMSIVSPLFDWVIVDSSPVNLVSDGVNLARACDGVLLIARGEVTKFETAQQAVATLEASKILGFVLNAVNTSSASSGYYDYESADKTR
jgi:capsular exopolysaccharide synthesis family protein